MLERRRLAPVDDITRPRLGLKHFFLWMICASLCLVVSQWIVASERSVYTMGDSNVSSALSNVTLTFTAPLSGMVFASALTLVNQYGRGKTTLLGAPGHWILMTIAVSDILVQVGRIALVCSTFPVASPASTELRNSVICLSVAFELVIYAIAARMVTDSIWRVSFGLLAFEKFFLLAFIISVNCLTQPIPLLLRPIVIICTALTAVVAIIAFYDLATRQTDWLHKAGLAAYLMIFGVSRGLPFFMYLFRN